MRLAAFRKRLEEKTKRKGVKRVDTDYSFIISGYGNDGNGFRISGLNYWNGQVKDKGREGDG